MRSLGERSSPRVPRRLALVTSLGFFSLTNHENETESSNFAGALGGEFEAVGLAGIGSNGGRTAKRTSFLHY